VNHSAHTDIQDTFLNHAYSLAERTIDPIAGTVSWQGKLVHLQRKELEVLALLASSDGLLVTRANFIAVVWDGNDLVGGRGVSDKIFSLRRALADHDEQQPIIRTIPRRGYQLTATAVQPVPNPAPAFANGQMVAGCPGWQLQRRLSISDVSESWLAHAQDESSPPRVFIFCRSEAHLRRLQRETTLLRYLSERLGERDDFVLVRDWQLQEPPYFLARDYCSYGSLTQWASSVGGLAAQTEVQREIIMLALATAVASVHEIGVVHGRLGATSILLDDREKNVGPQLKLGGFDLGALNDPGQLAPLKITAVGLSFVGTQAPTMADDIYALGVLLLQLAVGDLSAEPGELWLERVANAHWRKVIASCFGPERQRPSALQLHHLLSGKATEPEFENVAKPCPERVHDSLLGRTVGPYRLTDKLGEGGMGTVYLAEQREPVQRQVAVKLIKAGMDTAEVLARFEAERQALAMMNHVNVAAVYDAGVAQTGRPYFAMEYVPGLGITAHCDERELDVRSRIELFLQVCDGVLHAHQKGIIHRDLKPSNILIKAAQGQPATAKIIDFGVAKSLQRKLGSLTAHTQLGSFVGTRTYSSPEQINGNIKAMDTRTDTYSLGVVLYELLAGVTPYDEDLLAAKSPAELSRLISSEEPPALLTRFASLEATVESDIAIRRKLTVAQMKQTLSSDLAWIVAKCLERDPNARYASVLELEKDLRRWLENRPVEARPITRTYRLRKMVRRNRTAVILGSLVALALLLTTGAAIFGFVRAERALADARVAAKEADAAAEFQVKQIKAIDPAIMGMKLREILLAAIKQNDRPENAVTASRLTSLNMTDVALRQLDEFYFAPALAAIDHDFEESPLLKARLMQSLATTLVQMGQNEKAATLVESALTLRSEVLGHRHPLTLGSLRTRASINLNLGRYTQAQTDLRMALVELRAQLGTRHPQTIETMQDLGYSLLQAWNDKEAAEILGEALSASRDVFGAEDPRTLKAMVLLGEAWYRQDRLEQAEALAREAVTGFRKLNSKPNVDVAFALSTLANISSASGKDDVAEKYERDVLQQLTQLVGSDHPDTLTIRSNLALTLHGSNRLPEAIALFREILSDRKRIQGVDHPETMDTEVKLASSLRLSGQLTEAAQILQDVLKKSERNTDDSNTITFDTEYFLGLVMKDQGKLDEAERLLNESLVGRRRVAGESHMDTLASMKALEELKEIRRAAARHR
jgi:eukaryotic-like serine/threonine-protein kinase